MNKTLALPLRAWTLALSAAALVTGFLIATINAFDVSLIYLGLFLAVVAAGLLTNIWGGLAASGVAVFALAVLNQYVGIYPVQNRILNVATELGIFLAAGPLAGWLSRVIETGQQRLNHWHALAEARATHDETFNTLKPEWVKIRLEEEVERARRFSRPLALALLQFSDLSDVGSMQRRAALQALIRIARAATLPPAVVSGTEDGRLMLILPESSSEQARQILSVIETRAAREPFFPDGTQSLGRPLHQHGAVRTAVTSLSAEHATAEALLRDAASALGS